METSLSRRERERLHRRQVMLEAARSVFAERGFAQASVDEIAERAEFGKGTLYNYFEGGKADMLHAILDDCFEEVCALTKEALTQKPDDVAPYFATMLRRYIVALLTWFSAEKELFMILMKESYQMLFSDDPDQVHFVIHQQTELVNLLVPSLNDAMTTGELRPQHAEAYAYFILNTLFGHIRWVLSRYFCHSDQIRPDSEPDIAAIADFLTHLILHGLGNPTFTPNPLHATS